MNNLLSFLRLLRSARLSPAEREEMRRTILEKIEVLSVTESADDRLPLRMGEALEPLFEAARAHGQKLTESEREAIFRNLDNLTNHFAVTGNVDRRLRSGSPTEGVLLLLSRFISMPALAVLVMLCLTGGTVFAAEGADPHDVLYPVKIHVNENVRSALTLSSEAKAEWELTLAERRLEEAQELEAEAELDAETEISLADRFAAHAERVEERLRALEETGRLDLAAALEAKFESALEAHEGVFLVAHAAEAPAAVAMMKTTAMDSLEATEESSGSVMMKAEARIENDSERPLVVQIRRFLDADSSVEATVRITGDGLKTATEATVKAAENKISEVRKYIQHKATSSAASVTAEANARLDAAEAELATVKANMEAGAYSEAFSNVKNTLRSAQDAKVMIQNGRVSNSARVKVDVNSNTTIDSNSSDDHEDEKNDDDSVDIDMETDGDVHYESDNGSVNVNIDSNATSTVKVNID